MTIRGPHRPGPPSQAGGPAEGDTELTSLGATHVSALLAFRGQAAGGRLGGCDVGCLGAGAEVQLHSRLGPLCAPAVLPSHPVPDVVPPSPPDRMTSILRPRGPRSQRSRLRTCGCSTTQNRAPSRGRAPRVRALAWEPQSQEIRARGLVPTCRGRHISLGNLQPSATPNQSQNLQNFPGALAG